MTFKPLMIEDMDTIRPYLMRMCVGICDYTTGTMFGWRGHLSTRYAMVCDMPVIQTQTEANQKGYLLPLCENMEKGISILLQHLPEEEPVCFLPVPERYLSCFSDIAYAVQTEELCDYADYVYKAEDLIALSGKKYSTQRNHISQFLRDNDSWRFVPISDVDTDDLLRFLELNFKEKSYATGGSCLAEYISCVDMLQHLEAYRLLGGVLFAGDQPVGFSLGEIVGDTLFCHVEKAVASVRGCYPMLTNQFVKMFGQNVTFVNREDDMGDLGLRVSKERYHPIEKRKKYRVKVEKSAVCSDKCRKDAFQKGELVREGL